MMINLKYNNALVEDDNIGRVIDVETLMLKYRTLFLFEDINPFTAQSFIAHLFFLESRNPEKEITIYINSPGGSIYDCLGIIDAMRQVSSPLRIVGIGLIASAAAVILSAGTKGSRCVTKHSTVMIHQPSLQLGKDRHLQETELRIEAAESERLRKILEEIMARNTGKSIEEIHECTERDKYLNAEEALKYGLIDKVV